MSALNDTRLALRVGVRQARRDWGRSLLVVLLVAVPVTLLAAVMTLAATWVVTPSEEVSARMGSADVRLVPAGDRVVQRGAGRWDEVSHPMTRQGGEDAVADAAGALGLDPGDLTPVIGPLPTAGTTDEGATSVETLFTDPSHGATGDLVELVSGRLPESAHEVLVTEQGARRGLPTEGALSLRVQTPPSMAATSGHWFTGAAGARDVMSSASEGAAWQPLDLGRLQVVGVARSTTAADAVALPTVFGDDLPTPSTRRPQDPAAAIMWHATEWLAADLPEPDAEQVRAANRLGWVVQHRDAMEGDLSEELLEIAPPDLVSAVLVATGATLLLAQAALMVGPAFSIGYARQRRDLALLASNGATRAQLLRHLLGQAVVLGVLTALLGVVTGALLVWFLLAWAAGHWVQFPQQPVDPPVLWLALLALVAVATVVLSALHPARRVFQQDAARAVRAGFADPAPSRWVPVVLVPVWLAAALGLSTLPLDALSEEETVVVLIGLVLTLLVSAVLLVPWCLHTAGRLAGRLPLGPRLAVRDLARHRARSAPTVGAVTGAVALLVAGAMSGGAIAQSFSDDTGQDWTGSVAVDLGDDRSRTGLDAVTEEFPHAATLWASARIEDPAILRIAEALGQVAQSAENQQLWLWPGSCSREQVQDAWWSPLLDDRWGTSEGRTSHPCSGQADVLVVPTGQEDRLGLTEADVAALREGTALADSGQVPELGDRAHLTASIPFDAALTEAERRRFRVVADDPGTRPSTWSVPVALRTTDRPGATWQVLVPEAVLDGTATQPTRLTVVGDVSAWGALQLLVGGEVDSAFYRFSSEQVARLVVAAGAAVACLVLLLASVIGAALRQREAAREDGALAAVGADPGTRRSGAAWHALATGVLGSVLGTLVGLVPGARLTREVTGEPWAGVPAHVVWPEPWVWMALLLTILLATLVAGVLVSRRPDMASRCREG